MKIIHLLTFQARLLGYSVSWVDTTHRINKNFSINELTELCYTTLSALYVVVCNSTPMYCLGFYEQFLLVLVIIDSIYDSFI